VPELPFLTVLTDNLRRQVVGREIRDVAVRGVSVLKTVDPPIDRLRGARIVDVRRRGKYVLLDLSSDLVLVIHLMRNGRSAPRRSTGCTRRCGRRWRAASPATARRSGMRCR